MLSDLLFMKSLRIDLYQISTLESYVYAAFPLVIAAGIFISHLKGEKQSTMFTSVLGALFLMVTFKHGLDFMIELGCTVGDTILGNDNKIVKDWYSYVYGPSMHKEWSLSDISTWFNIVVEFITKHLLKWTLFILSIVNTIAYNLVKSTLSIVLLVSMIPGYRKIQDGLITYALSTLLWPIFLAVVISILDFIVKDHYDQLTVNHILGYVIALLFVIGYSYKFVFNILSGSGPASTLSSIGQSYANSATLMTMGLGATALFNKPKDMALRKMGSIGGRSLSGLKVAENSLRDKTGEKLSATVGAKSLESKSLTYGDIHSGNFEGNGLKSKYLNTMVKSSGAKDFVKHKLSQNPLAHNDKFSYSDFKEFKDNNKSAPIKHHFDNSRVDNSNQFKRAENKSLLNNSYFKGGNTIHEVNIENNQIQQPSDNEKVEKNIPAKDRYKQLDH